MNVMNKGTCNVIVLSRVGQLFGATIGLANVVIEGPNFACGLHIASRSIAGIKSSFECKE